MSLSSVNKFHDPSSIFPQNHLASPYTHYSTVHPQSTGQTNHLLSQSSIQGVALAPSSGYADYQGRY